MRFTKMHGLGNDYIYVNCFDETPPDDPSTVARKVSDRHFGIGADGLIFIKPGREGADAEMEMYNADGSKAEMCGNGLRCVVKYLHDYNLVRKPHLSVLTGAGVLSADVVGTQNDKATQIRLNMGAPILEGLKIPTTWNETPVLNRAFEIEGRSLTGTCVSMGNPHCVVYVDDVESFPVTTLGPKIETASFFPNRVNVEFVQVVSRSEVIQRTWERGSGETLACGTGASAVCVAGHLTGRTDRSLRVRLPGGDAQLEYTENGSVFLTGPAVEVFSGEIFL